MYRRTKRVTAPCLNIGCGDGFHRIPHHAQRGRGDQGRRAESQQAKVMAAIYDIKNSQPARSRAQITSDLIATAEDLISNGARGIIAGCTEIPLLVDPSDCPLPTLDSTRLLARMALKEALR
mgnify:CR=1 FL=1